jgi:Mlc titration factor MtfA (ptsG expression regulator)
MLNFFAIQQFNTGSKIILGICFTALFIMILYFVFRMIEMAFVLKKRKPLYTHFYPIKRKLSKDQKVILKTEFFFYKKLDAREKDFFEHRVASFIKDKHFIGREKLVITDEMKVLISATAVMLTFGFRDFYIGLIDKIFIYPETFYSNANKEYHKGEFNPKLKALVLSWKDFRQGFKIEDDNINLGIHEFVHAIHLNSMKERDVSSTVFSDSFKELTGLLSQNKALRDDLVSSRYFRDYAYTNQFEFVAVLIETFFETPVEFRNQFPIIYGKVKQMLNFDFARY